MTGVVFNNMNLEIYKLIILFLLGAIVGSFLNCFMWRARHGGSVLFGRSRCIGCRKQILAIDNVPIFSFLRLRGKCRFCGIRIPAFYFFTELATALIFVLVGYLNQHYASANFWFLVRDLFYVTILILVFVYDLLYKTILSRVVWLGGIGGLIFNLFLIDFSLGNLALAVLVGFGFFFLQYAVSGGRWIGGGDVRLGAMLGVWLLWPNIILALFLAYIIGAIFSLFLILKDRKYWRSALPFGVFLTVGAFITLYFGDFLVNWYLGLLV